MIVKFLKAVKRKLGKINDNIQRKLVKNIDHLFTDSPFNKLMVELDSAAEYNSKYREYATFRVAFEKKLRKIAFWFPYVRWQGKTYSFKDFKGVLSLRESGIDDTLLNTRMRFSIEIIENYFLSAKTAYLSENDTNYHKYLIEKKWFDLTTSVYAPGKPLHQDMTKLSYSDNSFDLIMSYEDIEHIPDYKGVLRELYRVTKPGGHILISVPFNLERQKTLTRAVVDEKGEVTHLMEPDYHGDPVLPLGVLCFYHFGWDMLEDFREVGFKNVKVIAGHDINKLILDELLFIVAAK